MKTEIRIRSILNAKSLDTSITGVDLFDLSFLELKKDLEIRLPQNLRLGHLVEKIVAEAIRISSNYDLLYENVQVIEDKETVGEIDFIIREHASGQVIHLELAYKFYLFDPSVSDNQIECWIGPNRRDTLAGKLDKLQKKQFPLLYRKSMQERLVDLAFDELCQKLCFLVSLYLPYECKGQKRPINSLAVKGYYLRLETFQALHISSNKYYLPAKREWGMEPSEGEQWHSFEEVEQEILASLKEKRAPLCWQKRKEIYAEFFVVWW